jgi:transcriptional regulator with XRE-family HTH domain
MSAPKLHNYLRMFRKRSGFTQQEIAFLIGCNHHHKISRYERGTRTPHLRTALAYQIIFQMTADDLFGAVFERVERDMRQRAKELLCKTNLQSCDFHTKRKIDFLKRLAGN